MQVDNQNITEIVRQIATRFNPLKIILFGSYAYGIPNEDSDVDLLVIMDFNISPTRQAVKILKELDYHFPLDLILKTPSGMESRVALGDFFLQEVAEKGKVLYERVDKRVD
jgi:predicted nucleotidyltransferase